MTASTILLNAASGAAGDPLFVENVFRTFLYTGDGSNGTNIVNGIDLSGEGGLVWRKKRTNSGTINDNVLVDTERGRTKFILSNSDAAEATSSNSITSFNNNGFTIVDNNSYGQNLSNEEYVSWTFRKAPKFFDAVTYTGNGSNRTISHDLGTTPGMILVKQTNGSTSWRIWHRSLGNSKYIRFQTDAATNDSSYLHWSSTDHTATTFSLGTNVGTNNSGDSYVAYLFAHNDSDGGYGDGADQDIIKCGSYTGNSAGDPNTDQALNFGFEPQFIAIKKSSGTGNWIVMDSMRTLTTDGNPDASLAWNTSASEQTDEIGHFSSTGFTLTGANANYNGDTYIYMAIRRGPMATPETASSVFDGAINFDESNEPVFNSGFVTDMVLNRQPQISSEFKFYTRLMGQRYLRFDTSLSSISDTNFKSDFMNGIDLGGNSNHDGWLWKRAPDFFDVVAYTGTGSAQNISHNLGAVPEMMWVKQRNNTNQWLAYHSALGNTKYIRMDGDFDGGRSAVTSSTRWDNTTPTSSVFRVGTAGDANGSGDTYIACLFATLDGISKVGSYTGNGSSQTINCGFSNGAKFVLIKQTDVSSGAHWFVFDTERGIVSGNDNALKLNSQNAHITNEDAIDPDSSGFIVNDTGGYVDVNNSGGSYIFYAVAT